LTISGIRHLRRVLKGSVRHQECLGVRSREAVAGVEHKTLGDLAGTARQHLSLDSQNLDRQSRLGRCGVAHQLAGGICQPYNHRIAA
jgi:hypothetical protein